MPSTGRSSASTWRWALVFRVLLPVAGHRALILGAYGRAAVMAVLGAAAMGFGGLHDVGEEEA